VRNVQTEDAAGLLSGIASGAVARSMLPWVPLMAGGERADIIEEWKRLAGLEPDKRQRAVVTGLALYFAELARRRAVWGPALEGWDVRESMLFKEWMQEALRDGRAEGLREGLREGQAAGIRVSLVAVLRNHFGTDVPQAVLDALQAQKDPAELDRWFGLALQAKSLDEFRAALGPTTNGAAPQA
jgi:hypothetical protein